MSIPGRRLASRHYAEAPLGFRIDTEQRPDGTYVATARGLDISAEADRLEHAVQQLKQKIHTGTLSGTL